MDKAKPQKSQDMTANGASHGRNSGCLSLPIPGWAVKVRLDADVAQTPVVLWQHWWEWSH
jgi:hypothetical protein